MQASAKITERHVYADAGHFKFFGSVAMEGGATYEVSCEQRPGAASDIRIVGGERIVRPAMIAAVVEACAAFSSRVGA